MKKVLCFGDSNTYGYVPLTGQRYSKDVRWSGGLQSLLGEDWKVFEEGCNNRTAFKKNPMGKIYSGSEILPELMSDDFDVVILSVGINDLQTQYNTQLEEFNEGIKKLINIVREKSSSARIILMAPPRVNEGILSGFFSTLFDVSVIEKSAQLPKIYEKIAKEENCEFINLDKKIKTSNKDGLHLEPAEHKIIAEIVFEKIKD